MTWHSQYVSFSVWSTCKLISSSWMFTQIESTSAVNGHVSKPTFAFIFFKSMKLPSNSCLWLSHWAMHFWKRFSGISYFSSKGKCQNHSSSKCIQKRDNLVWHIQQAYRSLMPNVFFLAVSHFAHALLQYSGHGIITPSRIQSLINSLFENGFLCLMMSNDRTKLANVAASRADRVFTKIFCCLFNFSLILLELLYVYFRANHD